MKTTNPDVSQQYEALLAHLPNGMSLAESEWKGNVVPKHFTVFCDHCRRSKAYPGPLLTYSLPYVVTHFASVHQSDCPLSATASTHSQLNPMTTETERKHAWGVLQLCEDLVLKEPQSGVARRLLEYVRVELAQLGANLVAKPDEPAPNAPTTEERVKRVAHAAIKLIMDSGLTIAEQNAALEHVEFAVNSAWETILIENEQTRQQLEVQHKEIRSLSMFTPTEQLRRKGLQPSV